jgi:hypothetical protein
MTGDRTDEVFEDGWLLDHLVGQLDGAEEERARELVAHDPEVAAEAAALRRDLDAFASLRCEVTGRAGLAARVAARRRRPESHSNAQSRGRVARGRALRRASVEILATALVAAAFFVILFTIAPGVGGRRATGGGGGDDAPAVAHVAVDGQRGTAARSFRALDESDRVPVLPSVEDVVALADEEQSAVVGAGVDVEGFDPEALGEAFAASVRSLESTHDPANGRSTASRRLAMLREAHSSGLSERRRMQAQRGVRPSDSRIESLAREVAARLEQRIASVPAGGRLGADLVPEVAAAGRALLAARTSGLAQAGGDARRAAEARAFDALLDRTFARLADELPHLEGGALASALAAFVDRVAARAEHRREVALLVEHGGRLVRGTLQLHDGRRPHLLHWTAQVDRLADAGRVFAVLPALGVDTRQTSRARLLVAAHLRERFDDSDRESPELLAALAYGFGDLVDLEWIDHRMMLWRPELLVPHSYTALEHLTWSSYPVRAGWARFQREMQRVAACATPPDLRDASALLLSLAVHDVSPGAAASFGLFAAADF